MKLLKKLISRRAKINKNYPDEKKVIEQAVARTIREYGETLRKLGNE